MNCSEGAMYWSIPMAAIGTLLAAAAKSTRGRVVIGPPNMRSNQVTVVRGTRSCGLYEKYTKAARVKGSRMAVSIPSPATAGMVVFFLAAAYNANEIASEIAMKGN